MYHKNAFMEKNLSFVDVQYVRHTHILERDIWKCCVDLTGNLFFSVFAAIVFDMPVVPVHRAKLLSICVYELIFTK